MTDAADVFTERFNGPSPLLLPVDKSSTLLLKVLLLEEVKKSERGEDVPFVDRDDVFAPTGIFVISTLSTIELEDNRSLFENTFCPGVFLSIVNPIINSILNVYY